MTSSNKRIRLKRQRKTDIALIVAFTVFIGIFFVLILVLPKHEGELSPNERRVLAAAPDASLDNIMDGGFSAETDTWLQDHFPLRNFFVSLYSYVNRYTGRNVAEDVIAGKDGRLFSAPVAMNETQLQRNGNFVGKFAAENGLNGNMVIIPSSGYMLEDELPRLHREYRDDEIIDVFSTAAGLNSIDVEALFEGSGDVSYYYYRTDHHLTMQGTYTIYKELADDLGYVPISESEYKKTAYEFYGTAYGSSGLMLTKPDSLETWVRKGDESIRVTTIDGSTESKHEGMLDTECLKADVVDKYAAYLYSNHGLTYLENPNVDGGSLLVLKDSYGNALVPFLAAHYRNIVMIDVRYYNSATDIPSDIVRELGISDFLVVYGTDSVAETNDLGWLR